MPGSAVRARGRTLPRPARAGLEASQQWEATRSWTPSIDAGLAHGTETVVQPPIRATVDVFVTCIDEWRKMSGRAISFDPIVFRDTGGVKIHYANAIPPVPVARLPTRRWPFPPTLKPLPPVMLF